MLRLEGIGKSYGRRRVLHQVSASCGPGESLVVLGANGSGKSTLLKIAAGLLEPDAGRVVLREQRVSPGTVAGRRHLGYLPDAPDAFPELTISELTTLTEALKDARTPPSLKEAWVTRLDLQGILAQPLRSLSFGQRKRAFLLAALLGNPWLLILDEPSNGLDPAGCALVAAVIRERRAAGQGTLVGSNDAAFVREVGGQLSRLTDGHLAPELTGSGTHRE
jgi:ABC-type multidrug transport system ATPase subunit